MNTIKEYKNLHDYYKGLGYKVSEIIESELFTTKNSEMGNKLKNNEITDYLILPTTTVPKSIKHTKYENKKDSDKDNKNKKNLRGLLTVYVKENKTQN